MTRCRSIFDRKCYISFKVVSFAKQCVLSTARMGQLFNTILPRMNLESWYWGIGADLKQEFDFYTYEINKKNLKESVEDCREFPEHILKNFTKKSKPIHLNLFWKKLETFSLTECGRREPVLILKCKFEVHSLTVWVKLTYSSFNEIRHQFR